MFELSDITTGMFYLFLRHTSVLRSFCFSEKLCVQVTENLPISSLLAQLGLINVLSQQTYVTSHLLIILCCGQCVSGHTIEVHLCKDKAME